MALRRYGNILYYIGIRFHIGQEGFELNLKTPLFMIVLEIWNRDWLTLGRNTGVWIGVLPVNWKFKPEEGQMMYRHSKRIGLYLTDLFIEHLKYTLKQKVRPLKDDATKLLSKLRSLSPGARRAGLPGD